MRGAKRPALSESAPIFNSNDSFMQSKRVIIGGHGAEPPMPLDMQRAESSRQHVKALNTQFASWVHAHLQHHPDELWEDGLNDYLNHAKSIKEKFSDVVIWLKANAAKGGSSHEPSFKDTTVKPILEIDKNNHNMGLEKPGFPAAPIASFGTPWSSGTLFNNKSPFTFGGSPVSVPGNANSVLSDHEASNEADGEDDNERPSSPSLKKSEEKGILVVHEVKCKLYVKSIDPADKDAWKDKGMGQLSIKCKEGVSKGSKESKPTVVIRNDVGKVLLNALLYPGIKTNKQKNSVVAIFHTSGDGDNKDTVVARTYLIKTKSEEDRDKLSAAFQDYSPAA